MLMLLLVILTMHNAMQHDCFFLSLEIIILGGRCKSWYLPYRLTEVPWNMVNDLDYLISWLNLAIIINTINLQNIFFRTKMNSLKLRKGWNLL